MANQQETRLVLRRMTKAQLVSLGGNMFIYSKRKTWIGAFVFSIAFFIVMQIFYTHSMTMNVVSILPVLVVLIAFGYTQNKAGNAYWNKIKGQKEPLEIN